MMFLDKPLDANAIARKEGIIALRDRFDAQFVQQTGAHAPEPIIKSSAAFISGFVPPDYLIDGLLQRRFCYSMTAPTGAGKTAILLLISACVALGQSIGEREVERGRVLYFAGENPDDVRMRWLAMAEHIGFDIDAIDVYFIDGVVSLADLKERIFREAEEIGGAWLAIIDTSAAYFIGDDENSK